MSYRVILRPQLAENLQVVFFLGHEHGRDVEPLREALGEIMRRLATDPGDEGESRDDNERVLIVGPLSVVFEVIEVQRIVLIHTAILYPGQRL